MLYRTMPKGGPELSILGFGCMRLPVRKDGTIDEPVATAMIRSAIDAGVNYVDTAYPYHNGESEPVVGRALGDGYRDRVYLATKLPSWLISSREDMDRYLDEQLERLQADHIDYYLLHGLNQEYWENLSFHNATGFLDEAIGDGRIRYAGFSFHDSYPLFRDIVDAYDWTFAQIQYNFMDEEYQAGTDGLRYAAKKRLGIVIMEPIRGGLLAKEIPGITDTWQQAPVRRSPAEWALRWVWDHEEPTVVLSGMSTPEQVQKNIAAAEGGFPGSLTGEEHALYEKVRKAFRERQVIPCTGCGYCLPCPAGISIPECFEYFNQGHMYNDKAGSTENYTLYLGGVMDGIPSFASLCQECGQCEMLCPQRIPIREELKKVAKYFGK